MMLTNKESIKWLQSLKSEIGKQSNQNLWHYEEALDMIIKALQEDEWIPVSERLPSESGRYLVTYPLFTRKDKWLNIMNFGNPSMPNIKVKGKCWYMSDDEYGDVVYDDVLAWMPLPPVYQGE